MLMMAIYLYLLLENENHFSVPSNDKHFMLFISNFIVLGFKSSLWVFWDLDVTRT